MNATCSPFSIATSAASSATIVLPAPTSPCSSRFIGVGRCMSSTISFSALRCPSVSLNGRMRARRFADAIVDLDRPRLRLADRRALAQHQAQLEQEELLEDQPHLRGCPERVQLIGRCVQLAENASSISAARRSGRLRRRRTSSGNGSGRSAGSRASTSNTSRRCIFGVIAPAFS